MTGCRGVPNGLPFLTSCHPSFPVALECMLCSLLGLGQVHLVLTRSSPCFDSLVLANIPRPENEGGHGFHDGSHFLPFIVVGEIQLSWQSLLYSCTHSSWTRLFSFLLLCSIAFQLSFPAKCSLLWCLCVGYGVVANVWLVSYTLTHLVRCVARLDLASGKIHGLWLCVQWMHYACEWDRRYCDKRVDKALLSVVKCSFWSVLL